MSRDPRGGLRGGLSGGLRDVARVVHRRRALLAAGLVAGAVATALPQLAPPAPPGREVLAAARDLPAGTVLAAADLVRVALPAALAPAGALDAETALVGRLVAGPVRRGEALTDVRLLGAGLLAETGPGLVATPVRLADPAGAALLSAGDRVDVLAAPADGAAASAPVVAAGVTVLAVPAEVEAVDGALVVLATTPATAARLAAAAVASRLSVTVRAR